MLQDRLTDFDLLVRSTLEGAEESVPPGVWDGVCSQLDKLAAPLAGVAGAAMASAESSSSGAAAAGTGASSTGAAGTSGATGTVASAATTASHTVGIIAGAVAAVGIGVSTIAILNRENGDNGPVPANVVEIVQEPEQAEIEVPSDTVELMKVIRRMPSPSVPVQGPVEEAMPEEEAAMDEGPSLPEQPVIRPVDKDREPRLSQAAPSRRKAFSVDFHGRVEVMGFASGVVGAAPPNIYEARTKETTQISELGESSFKPAKAIGMGLRFHISPRWSIGTGIGYMKLERSFEGTYKVGEDTSPTASGIRNEQHYVGVPLTIYYSLLDNPRWELWLSGGGMLEKCLYDKYRADSRTDVGSYFRNDVTKLQKSLGIGLGLEYHVYDHVGIYVSPALRYYLDSGQPFSLRTKEPWRISAEGGVRFSF